MKRSLLVLAAVVSLGLALPTNSSAQFDHLTCFKVRDSVKFSALATLDALQNAFDPGQCKISGKAKLFCVPTNKMVDEFEIDKQPGTLLPIPGLDPQQDQICYKVKCPKATIADRDVADQFAARPLSRFKAKLLCVPAVKLVPGSCLHPEPPQCPFDDPCVSGGLCAGTQDPCLNSGNCAGTQCCCTAPAFCS